MYRDTHTDLSIYLYTYMYIYIYIYIYIFIRTHIHGHLDTSLQKPMIDEQICRPNDTRMETLHALQVRTLMSAVLRFFVPPPARAGVRIFVPAAAGELQSLVRNHGV